MLDQGLVDFPGQFKTYRTQNPNENRPSNGNRNSRLRALNSSHMNWPLIVHELQWSPMLNKLSVFKQMEQT